MGTLTGQLLTDHPVIFRADHKTCCRVELKTDAYVSFINGRKEYTKGSITDWNVDWLEYSLIELVNDARNTYKWASYQTVEFWYVNKDNKYVKLRTDAELLALLQSSSSVQFDMIVVGEEPNNDNRIVLHNNATIVDCPAMVGENQIDLNHEFLEQPIFGGTIAGPPRTEEEEETDHYMIEGVDPDGDEPPGANEEWRYFKNGNRNGQPEQDVSEQQQDVHVPPPHVLPTNFHDHDTECVPTDESVVVASSYVPIGTYDRDDPKIKKGSTFDDKSVFIMTFKQFCIKNEFETLLQHSDSERYMAKCKFPGCRWSLYAKKMLGCESFMVCCPCVYHF